MVSGMEAMEGSSLSAFNISNSAHNMKLKETWSVGVGQDHETPRGTRGAVSTSFAPPKAAASALNFLKPAPCSQASWQRKETARANLLRWTAWQTQAPNLITVAQLVGVRAYPSFYSSPSLTSPETSL